MSLTRETLVRLDPVVSARLWRITNLGFVFALPRSGAEDTKRVEVHILVEGAVAQDLKAEIVRRTRDELAGLEIELLTFQSLSATEG